MTTEESEIWVRREEQVEAIQLKKDRSNFDEVVKWLRDHGAGVYPGGEYIKVITDQDAFFINPGDWGVQLAPYDVTMYPDETFKRAFYQRDLEEDEYKPTRVFMAEAPDGSLWAESSDEIEVRGLARPDDKIYRLFRTEPKGQWRQAEEPTPEQLEKIEKYRAFRKEIEDERD